MLHPSTGTIAAIRIQRLYYVVEALTNVPPDFWRRHNFAHRYLLLHVIGDTLKKVTVSRGLQVLVRLEQGLEAA